MAILKPKMESLLRPQDLEQPQPWEVSFSAPPAPSWAGWARPEVRGKVNAERGQSVHTLAPTLMMSELCWQPHRSWGTCPPGAASPSSGTFPESRLWEPFPGLNSVLPHFISGPPAAPPPLFSEATEGGMLACGAFRGTLGVGGPRGLRWTFTFISPFQ